MGQKFTQSINRHLRVNTILTLIIKLKQRNKLVIFSVTKIYFTWLNFFKNKELCMRVRFFCFFVLSFDSDAIKTFRKYRDPVLVETLGNFELQSFYFFKG